MKHDIQKLIGNTLRRGVITACMLATLGGGYYLAVHGGDMIPDYGHFPANSAMSHPEYTSLKGIWQGLLDFNAYSCIQLGVVALILTPILRVLLSLSDFFLEKDWLYALITGIVLAVIICNSIGGS